ncbi:MAG: Gfo/Idh/MocA family oxidoreductase [Candidatus Omnitrophica bacterium]|nr:Gfo/Idh/MocA family oxidoreductase [Candidatus Omnitrophota bacterium]MDD5429609.1 Gfo/Idh/MocA family oxidoreductase [Candidatus Omnitrophota bacterium]
MKAKTINIGVIGCADIAERFVIPAIKNLTDQYKLVGVASRDQAKALQSAVKFSLQPYCGYNSLLESGQIDAVYIPLPSALHQEWAGKALKLGLHVLVEKSLACSYKEVQWLNQLAKNEGLVLIENFQFRFHSQLAIISKMLSGGVIGELRCLRSSFGFPLSPDPGNIRYQKNLGGGALFDAGAYPIKIAQHFLGLNLSVEAANLTFDHINEVDIWGGAYLKQNNGKLFAEIAFGFDNYYQCSIELWGSKGTLCAKRIFTAPPGHFPEIILETVKGIETIRLQPDHHFKNILRHFYQLIINPKSLEEEYRQNENQARLIEELRIKAYEKQ